MHSVPLRDFTGEKLDEEWMKLIKEAKDAGLTVQDVRRFFMNADYMDKGDFSGYKAAE